MSTRLPIVAGVLLVAFLLVSIVGACIRVWHEINPPEAPVLVYYCDPKCEVAS